MSKFPRITGKQVVESLRRASFELIRIRGSHYFMPHPDGRATVVPVHRGETIGPGLLSKILRNCEMTQDEFRELL